MNQQILSQDEVDALLQGITGESQKLEEEEAPSGGIRDYDIASQERIVRGRMPTMEIINERCNACNTTSTRRCRCCASVRHAPRPSES